MISIISLSQRRPKLYAHCIKRFIAIGKPKCKSQGGKNGSLLLSKPENKKITVCVEGNIASGKTTFLEHYNNYADVQVYEDVVETYRNIQGRNALAKMYEDPTRWSFTLQTYVQLTMLDRHIVKPKIPVKIMERSIFSAKYCFVENLHRSGKMSDLEHVVLTRWFEWILKHHNIDVDLIVYLQTRPETLHDRIVKRGREEETAIPLEYLQSLHELHEDWLIKKSESQTKDVPVLVIDANQDQEEMHKIFDEKILTTFSSKYGLRQQ